MQTDIASIDLRVVLLLALLGNITVRQFREQRKNSSVQPVENSTGTVITSPEANKSFGHRPNDAPAEVLFTYLCAGAQH